MTPGPSSSAAEAVSCVEPSSDVASVEPLDDATLAVAAKALSHPARLRILRLLAARDTCVTGELITDLGLAQSTISEHLRILRQAGLVQGEIEGPRMSYCLNVAGLAALKAAVIDL